jgi:hypothetical protein
MQKNNKDQITQGKATFVKNTNLKLIQSDKIITKIN